MGVPGDQWRLWGCEQERSRQLRSLLRWLSEDEPAGGEEEEMPTFGYRPSGKAVPPGWAVGRAGPDPSLCTQAGHGPTAASARRTSPSRRPSKSSTSSPSSSS